MRILLVDGYNVVRNAAGYRHMLAENDMDAARAALVSDVAAFAQHEYCATVVFDGGANPASTGVPHETAGVQVIFSAHGTDADATLAKLARVQRDQGAEVIVVTSDADLQWTVLGMGCVRMSAPEFTAALAAGGSERAEHNPAGSRKGTFEDRLPADMRDRLRRWARGQD